MDNIEPAQPMIKFIAFTLVFLFTFLLFGFGGSLAVGALPLAQILFYCFVALFILCLLLGPGIIKRR